MLDSYNIRAQHWVLAVTIAVAAHAIFVYQYKHEASLDSDLIEEQGITIKLKKIVVPTQPVAEIIETVVTPPAIIEKPEKIVKEKPPKPKHVKPVVQQPKVLPIEEPISQENIQQELSNEKEITKITEPSVSASTSNNSRNKNNNLSQIRNEYLARLNLWLSKHKRYPAIARKRKQEDTVKVSFVIDANGRLLSYQLEEASKFASLNKAVVNLLQSASPMPKVPQAIRDGQSEFEYTIPIEYSLIVK
ncbi:MAG: TonB family protein [Pseudomonadota bacterium]